MRCRALATDYDGTLATDGGVDEETVAALRRLLASGRWLVLVTGRQLDELLGIFPHVELFERVVAENGAVLYHPGTHQETLLGQRPPAMFVAALQRRGVERISVGRVIVATWGNYETTVRETIHELGLELEVILNKDAVMVLPRGVNKSTGLRAALSELGLSPVSVVGVGDAENDVDFLRLCGWSVAVANALPLVKERVDFVTRADHGTGVVELIDRLVAHDLSALEPQAERPIVSPDTGENGAPVHVEE
jgi:hydroxymethylpyrimidine pyrophosphatase-like HAD family hydrolase